MNRHSLLVKLTQHSLSSVRLCLFSLVFKIKMNNKIDTDLKKKNSQLNKDSDLQFISKQKHMRHIHIQTTNIRKYKQFLTNITRGKHFILWVGKN